MNSKESQALIRARAIRVACEIYEAHAVVSLVHAVCDRAEDEGEPIDAGRAGELQRSLRVAMKSLIHTAESMDEMANLEACPPTAEELEQFPSLR